MLTRKRGGAWPRFRIPDRWLSGTQQTWPYLQYLTKKLRALKAAGIGNLILAIDENRRCAEGDLPPNLGVVWFGRKLDPAAVVALLR